MKKEKRVSKKAKKIILLCCLVVAIAVIIIGVIYFTQGNDQKHEQVKQDVTLTLDAILNRSNVEDIYISGIFFDENSHGIFSDSEEGATVSDHVKYEIKEINLDDGNESVKINISSPDVYKILVEIVKEDHSFDGTDDLLESVTKKLNSSYPTIDSTIECPLEYKNGHWYIKPNEDLFNSLSGNLYNYYIDLGKHTVEDILGGGSDE